MSKGNPLNFSDSSVRINYINEKTNKYKEIRFQHDFGCLSKNSYEYMLTIPFSFFEWSTVIYYVRR